MSNQLATKYLKPCIDKAMDKINRRMPCSESPVTKTTAKSFVNSCPTGGQKEPTRIN